MEASAAVRSKWLKIMLGLVSVINYQHRERQNATRMMRDDNWLGQ